MVNWRLVLTVAVHSNVITAALIIATDWRLGLRALAFTPDPLLCSTLFYANRLTVFFFSVVIFGKLLFTLFSGGWQQPTDGG